MLLGRVRVEHGNPSDKSRRLRQIPATPTNPNDVRAAAPTEMTRVGSEATPVPRISRRIRRSG
jgi:hypothetical protein